MNSQKGNMMNPKKSKYIMIVIFIILYSFAWAQDFTAGDIITLHVNDYCLIESNHAPISLTLGSSVAGAPITSDSNSDMFLKLSSLVPGGTNREVLVRISSGSLPPGTSLSILPTTCTLINSGGDLGQVKSTPVILSGIDQNIITLIGSCYTGTGYNDGYQITYTWAPIDLDVNYALIEATTTPTNITVVFTISAHDGN